MANFIIVIDSNIERRNKFIKSVRNELSPVPGLAVSALSSGDFCALWACAAGAPVTTSLEKGHAAVIWGEPVSDKRYQKIDASELTRLWCNSDTRTFFFFNGFYAAAAYSVDSGLAVGADLLGIYPVYYWQTENVLLVASSPELFKFHPCFKQKLNPQGLVFILLTMHLFDGQTLMQGVKRLAAGHMLIAEPGQNVKEVLQYKIRPSTEHFDLPFSAQVDILGNAIEDTLLRHTSAKKHYSLLLSGGLDSRILAGFLAEKDMSIDALTLGLESDIEMKTAGQVARHLGLPQNRIELDYEDYPKCADTHAKWQHINNGFNGIFDWSFRPQARPLIMGHILDAVIGTRYINWAYCPMSKKMSFDSFFSHANKWAIRPDILKRLLNNQICSKELVDETICKIKNTYNNYCDSESRRAWCFNLYNRQRFHVGGGAWAISFGSAPVMPALDRKLLECAASMPTATIAERRAEMELLCSRFPKLAALPLDRNSYDTTPLRPRVRHLVVQEISKKLNWFFRFSDNGKIEHRYYYRIYDFNNPGWMAVRQQAEPCRNKLYDLFNKEVLNELLPDPAAEVNLQDKITDASGLKLLTGLILWSKNNL